MKEQEISARLSKAGLILCGRQDEEGCYTCDGEVATTIPAPRPVGSPGRRLVPPAGWRLDPRKGIWHQTTQIEDRRAHGRPQRPLAPDVPGYPFLPALVRCPKCRTVQWLDPPSCRGVQVLLPPYRTPLAEERGRVIPMLHW